MGQWVLVASPHVASNPLDMQSNGNNNMDSDDKDDNYNDISNDDDGSDDMDEDVNTDEDGGSKEVDMNEDNINNN